MARPTAKPYKHPDEVVQQVLQLHDGGWTPAQIQKVLKGRGHEISRSTIHRWANPEQAKKDREASTARQRRQREEARQNRPPNKYAGLTGLSRKIAILEDKVKELEEEMKEAKRDNGHYKQRHTYAFKDQEKTQAVARELRLLAEDEFLVWIWNQEMELTHEYTFRRNPGHQHEGLTTPEDFAKDLLTDLPLCGAVTVINLNTDERGYAQRGR